MDTAYHIGYSKAASTYIQDAFGMNEKLFMPDRDLIAKELVRPHALSFDTSAARSCIEALRNEAGARLLLISHERLIGCPFSGFFDTKEIADRLKQITPNARIIIVIREQYSMISSIYKQYIGEGGTRDFQNFIHPMIDTRTPLFDYRALEYSNAISYYIDLFGDDAVRVLLFEDLTSEPVSFMTALYAFVGALGDKPVRVPHSPVHPSIPEERIDEQRIRNLFEGEPIPLRDPYFASVPRFYRMLFRLFPLLPKNDFLATRSVAEQAKSLLEGTFKESNRRLAALIERDLGGYGYET